MITVKNVSKSFKVENKTLKVLDNINFKVKNREFVSIIGPNGCGKTTLLKIICGLLKPNSGEVLIDDVKIENPNRKIGIIFQELGLFPWMTVRNNIEFPLRLMNNNGKECGKRSSEIISFLKLTGFENYYPYQISGGMKQKVALGRTLAYDPDIILMDEPFASVDSQTRHFLEIEISKIWSELNKTIIFVTHNIEEAIFLADRTMVLTRSPAKIKKVVKIELSRPRAKDGKVEYTNKFQKLRTKILNLLNDECEYFD